MRLISTITLLFILYCAKVNGSGVPMGDNSGLHELRTEGEIEVSLRAASGEVVALGEISHVAPAYDSPRVQVYPRSNALPSVPNNPQSLQNVFNNDIIRCIAQLLFGDFDVFEAPSLSDVLIEIRTLKASIQTLTDASLRYKQAYEMYSRIVRGIGEERDVVRQENSELIQKNVELRDELFCTLEQLDVAVKLSDEQGRLLDEQRRRASGTVLKEAIEASRMVSVLNVKLENVNREKDAAEEKVRQLNLELQDAHGIVESLKSELQPLKSERDCNQSKNVKTVELISTILDACIDLAENQSVEISPSAKDCLMRIMEKGASVRSGSVDEFRVSLSSPNHNKCISLGDEVESAEMLMLLDRSECSVLCEDNFSDHGTSKSNCSPNGSVVCIGVGLPSPTLTQASVDQLSRKTRKLEFSSDDSQRDVDKEDTDFNAPERLVNPKRLCSEAVPGGFKRKFLSSHGSSASRTSGKVSLKALRPPGDVGEGVGEDSDVSLDDFDISKFRPKRKPRLLKYVESSSSDDGSRFEGPSDPCIKDDDNGQDSLPNNPLHEEVPGGQGSRDNSEAKIYDMRKLLVPDGSRGAIWRCRCCCLAFTKKQFLISHICRLHDYHYLNEQGECSGMECVNDRDHFGIGNSSLGPYEGEEMESAMAQWRQASTVSLKTTLRDRQKGGLSAPKKLKVKK